MYIRGVSHFSEVSGRRVALRLIESGPLFWLCVWLLRMCGWVLRGGGKLVGVKMMCEGH